MNSMGSQIHAKGLLLSLLEKSLQSKYGFFGSITVASSEGKLTLVYALSSD